MSKNLYSLLFSFISTLIISNHVNACSTCSCSFNSDWASQGYANNRGLRFDTRFDFIDQKSLRYGTGNVQSDRLNLSEVGEIQKFTTTRSTMFGLDYSPNRYWGVRISVPYLDRTHGTIAGSSHEDGHSDEEVADDHHGSEKHGGVIHEDTDLARSYSSTNGFGDTTILGRYQGFTNFANLGLQLGLKLPTGSIDDKYNAGPLSGQELDRALQNGTGTVNGLVGAYYFDSISSDFDYFIQTLLDQPFNKRDDFKPSTNLLSSIGLSYKLTERFKPQLQLNHKYENRESGALADRDNSGGNFLYLTPGFNLNYPDNLNIYSLIQIPIYQDVNGYQLQPHQILSVGLRYQF